ncbi:hypothetical protein C6P42_004212, partial [Pichia californica]
MCFLLIKKIKNNDRNTNKFDIFIINKYSQTEWSKSGQYTSITDLSLTPFGVKQMIKTGEYLI